MDGESKRLLRLICILSVFLSTLIWVKRTYFESDFQLKYQVADPRQTYDIYQYTADTSLYHFSSHEGKMLTKTNVFSKAFLDYFPHRVGDWVGTNIVHQYADIKIFRLYYNKKLNNYLWLMVVHGSHQSQFHAAEVCYISEGWDVAARDIKQVMMNDVKFPIRYSIAQKDKTVHMVSYWYLFKTPKRNVSDGTLLFRVSVDAPRSEEEGQTALLDFIQSFSNIVVEGEGSQKEDENLAQLPLGKTAPPAEIKKSKYSSDRQQAMSWMMNQSVPNQTVPFPYLNRRYMLLSYELSDKNPLTENDRSYKYIFSRSSIYDDALGIIAFTMAERFDEAERLIEAFDRIINSDGSLWFSYNTHNEWPNQFDHDEAIMRSGASAWVGYAITYYLRYRLEQDAKQYKKQRIYQSYLSLAEKIAERLLKDQVLDPTDFRYGFVTGGKGSHNLIKDKKKNKIIEKYSPNSIAWASMEHNIDIYFLLKDLKALTGKQKYKKALILLQTQMLKKAWNKEEGQLNRGIRKEGADQMMPLDCASWAVMMLLSMGETKKALQAATAMERFFVTDSLEPVSGYRPYYKGLVYDELELNKVFYPHKPNKSWADVPMVWSEGSLGVAMAYLKMGQKNKAEEIILEMLKMSTQKGGIKYATREIPFQFSPSASMAGTGWLLMVLHALENPRALNLFWD